MKKYKLSIIWFSYKNDEILVLESIKRMVYTLKKTDFIESTLYLENDGNNPISEDLVNYLKNTYNIIEHKTTYKRSGNLNGLQNLIGQTSCFKEDSKDSDAILKIDSDVMVFDLSWIKPMLESDKALLTGTFIWGRWNYPLGGCYCIKTHFNCYHCKDKLNVLEMLANDCKIYPSWNGGYEDYEIGQRLHRFAFGDKDYAIRYSIGYKGLTKSEEGKKDGFWCIDPFDITKELITNCKVIIMGNGLTIKHLNDMDKNKYKEIQIKVMNLINKDLYE